MNPDELCMGCMQDRRGSDRCPDCGWVEGTRPRSALHLPPRTLLDNQYVIGRVLGHGGFGITYVAWDLQLARRLAIKEYLPSGDAARASGELPVTVFAPDEFEFGLKQFLQEGQVLARFQGHPGIVNIVNFFRANRTAYLVMEFLDGISLEDYLKSRGERVDFRTAVSILTPAMDALREVHREGFLHRDVSPDNLIVLRRGGLKLIDFGAARFALSQKSRNLSVLLKEGYAPPEQYFSTGRQGPWTDVYAAAATLYRMVTGVVPPPSMDRRNKDDLQSLRQLEIEVPPRAHKALMRALHVDFARRCQSMEDFQAELAEPSGPPPPPLPPSSQDSALQRFLDRSGSLIEAMLDAPVRLWKASSTLRQRVRRGWKDRKAHNPFSRRKLPKARIPQLGDAMQRIPPTARWLAAASMLAVALIVLALALRGPAEAQKQTGDQDRPSSNGDGKNDDPSNQVKNDDPRENNRKPDDSQNAVPVPSILSLNPNSVPAASREVRLSVHGRDFRSDSLVEWNRQSVLSTSYVSPTQLDAVIPASALSAPGAAQVTVWSPIGNDLGYRSKPATLSIIDSPLADYQRLVDLAHDAFRRNDYPAAQSYAQQASSAAPDQPLPYDMLAFLELYHHDRPSASLRLYRRAINLGGHASFRLRHDHSGLSFAKFCSGFLRVYSDRIEFESDGDDSFKATARQIVEAKWNRSSGFLPTGRERHHFHIKTNSRNYNLAGTSNQRRQEGEIILQLLPKPSNRGVRR